nr:reverse transcriptase domain-containing protein [Tanacetum cinerariifolium]
MIRATQPTTIQSVILKARALTNKAGSCGTLSKSSEKRKEVAESSKQGGSWFDNKRAKLGKGFMMAIPTKNGYAGSHQKCAKCHGHHLEGVPCLLCFNCQKPCHFSRDCQSSVKSVAPVNVVRIGNNQRVGYECCSPDHFRNTCPNLNRAPCQVGNCLTTEGSCGTLSKSSEKRKEVAESKMAPTMQSNPNNNDANPNIAAIIAQQLQTIIPQIVTQVTIIHT